MNKKEFDLLKEIPNFVVFYGNEFYLEMYQKKLEEKFKNENILKLYFDEFDKNTAKTHLLENSLFGGKNILIVKTNKWNKEIEELKKLFKKQLLFYFLYGK
ncbi:hypothetical protein [Lebetimonas sp. JS138]|uniref:hypothetical protein n=1 Tax=Lebetimonas sp. JS138 TaxID=990072 RepID=UPI0004AE549F|nr:hypothetical protein [Lebetimonas sp. JS138]